jgi:hypothetical protein
VRLPEVTLGIVEDDGLVRTICEWSISANRLGAARSKALNKEKGRELDALALILMWHVEDYFGCRGVAYCCGGFCVLLPEPLLPVPVLLPLPVLLPEPVLPMPEPLEPLPLMLESLLLLLLESFFL